MNHTRLQILPPMQYLLDSAHIIDAQVESVVEKQRQKSKGQRWCCAICGTYVTDDGHRINIDGSHEHHKINPHGHSFRFRSFKYAEGCGRTGQPTAEYSWYTGYLWQFAQCVRCKTQLGWYFAGVESFYGLINQQIVQCSEEQSL
jgi:hypothetical protein